MLHHPPNGQAKRNNTISELLNINELRSQYTRCFWESRQPDLGTHQCTVYWTHRKENMCIVCAIITICWLAEENPCNLLCMPIGWMPHFQSVFYIVIGWNTTLATCCVCWLVKHHTSSMCFVCWLVKHHTSNMCCVCWLVKHHTSSRCLLIGQTPPFQYVLCLLIGQTPHFQYLLCLLIGQTPHLQ